MAPLAEHVGIYTRIQEAWNVPRENPLWRGRLIAWRREPATLRLERPTRLDRARSLGYKPKSGVLVIRQRVPKGPHRRTWTGGRHSNRMRTIKALRKSYQLIAEERAGKPYTNCEVLNSYWVAEDGKHYWYEVILVDRDSPAVKSDPALQQIAQQRGRVYRGRTSAGQKMRGLHRHGTGAEKARPSRRAHHRRM